MNDDFFVNSVDALFILQWDADLLEALFNLASGDVNHNGRINSVDAQLVLQLDAGLIDGFSAGHGWADRLRAFLSELA